MGRTKAELRGGREGVRRLVAGFEKSGLSIPAFARSRGIPVATMRYRLSAARRRCEPLDEPAGEAPALFAPVRIVPDPPSPSPAGFSLDLRGGRVLRVPPQFDEGDLARIARAVESC